MALNTLENSTATSAAYLNSRFAASSLSTETAKGSAIGFGQVLESATTTSSAPLPVVTKSETIPFASFIDNIDFSKFKSDPLHFGQFIPVSSDPARPAIETINAAASAEIVKSSAPGLDVLLGTIEAQLKYSAPLTTPPTEAAAAEVPPTFVAAAIVSDMKAPPLNASSAVATESQAVIDLTSQYFAGASISQIYNAGEILAETLTEKTDGNTAA